MSGENISTDEINAVDASPTHSVTNQNTVALLEMGEATTGGAEIGETPLDEPEIGEATTGESDIGEVAMDEPEIGEATSEPEIGELAISEGTVDGARESDLTASNNEQLNDPIETTEN